MTAALTTTESSLSNQRANQQVRPLSRRLSLASPTSKSASTPPISFKRHDRLSFIHHSLWRIQSGFIRTLTLNPEGEYVPLGFWSVGDIVGYPIAQTYPYEAECLTPVEAEYLSINYPLSREMVISQIRQSNSLLRIAHCRDSEQRILQFVCWLAEHFGQAKAEGIEVSLRLTHQEMAESIGTTRVTVTRLLKSLEKKGHIIWKTNQKMVFQQTLKHYYVCSSGSYPT